MAGSPLRDRDKRAAPEDLLVDPIQAQSAWPRDDNGEPMIQVYVQAREHIGLPDYSNITVGPSGITMFVAKGQSEILNEQEKAALASSMNQLSELLELQVIAEQRGIVLESIDPAKQ